MNKNLVIFGVAVVIILAALLIAGRLSKEDANQTNSDAPQLLAATEKSFDFGQISMAAGNVKHMFNIKNTSTESVTIGQMYTSCMCTNATLMMNGQKYGPHGMPGHGFMPKINQTLAPGAEAQIEVTFNPAAHGPAGVGRIERVVYLESNNSAPVELQIAATVRP